MNRISVVICCYNSTNRLPVTLEYLAAQKINFESSCELVVVDNNSSDLTAATARSEWKRLGTPFPLTVVSESRPGLSFARRKGVQTARYEYICFCDDDNWLSEDYLETAVAIMKSDPTIGVTAGQGIPVAETAIPNWFYSYISAFACGVLARDSGDITSRKCVWGAGMVIRRSVYLDLLRAGFTHQTSDRKGEGLTSGGDNEICFWHVLAGFKLWYDERLVSKHWMPSERLTKTYLRKLSDAQRESDSRLEVYKGLIEIHGRKKNLKGLMKAAALCVVNEKKSPYVRLYLPSTLRRDEKILLKKIRAWISNYRRITQASDDDSDSVATRRMLVDKNEPV